jgi:hypothetical protein
VHDQANIQAVEQSGKKPVETGVLPSGPCIIVPVDVWIRHPAGPVAAAQGAILFAEQFFFAIAKGVMIDF